MLGNATNMSSSGYGEEHSVGGTFGSAATAMDFNERMMRNQQAYNSEEAQKNRDWQKMMSDTAYQRAVKDMVKAGINPILAASNGGAAMGSGGQGASGMAAGMPENYTESSGFNMNSANSVSNWALQLESIGQALGGGLQNIWTLMGGQGNMPSFDKIASSMVSSAKEAIEKGARHITGLGNGAGRYSQYDRYMHGREWK